jgi:hypothetical protein
MKHPAILAVGLGALLLVGSLIPRGAALRALPALGIAIRNDKPFHVVGFAALALLGSRGARSVWRSAGVLGGGATLGAGIELMQAGFQSHSHFESFDFLADVAGLAVGLSIYHLSARRSDDPARPVG